MSCNTCDKSFGLVTREKDCKNCGFSYCSSCLRYKQYVAKVNQNVKVCGPCNRVLSNPKATDNAPRSPPSALKKRLDRLNSLPESKHPVTVYKDGAVAKLRFGLPAQDQEIADRLQQLKSTGGEPSAEESEDEIRTRLNKLRGVDATATATAGQSNSILVSKPDQPASVQADQLLKQIGEQVVIEKSMPNPDEELEERLARLKGVDVDQVRHPGKGLANDPLETSQDDSLLLHDHSSYTIVNTGDDQDPEGLVKEVSNINKEKENVNDLSNQKTIWTIKEIRQREEAEKGDDDFNEEPSESEEKLNFKEEIPYHFPIKEADKVDVAKYANEFGIIETVDTDLTCKMCLHGYRLKHRFLDHCKTDCLAICQWKDSEKEAEEHEHEWVNIAFIGEVEAMNYARDKLEAEFLYKPIFKDYGSSKYIMYACHANRNSNLIKGVTKCKATLRIRKSKRYVDEHTLVPVYELIGCVYHNHQLEFKPCMAKHEHDVFDETFDTLEEGEACLAQLQKIHTYRRRDCKQDGGRVFMNCKKKDNELGGVCKAHVHMVQRPIADGSFIYRIKGCLAHCHPPTQGKHRTKFCNHDHDHNIIDMKFKSMADFQVYLEDSELDCQFSKHTASMSAHTKTRCHQYICSRHTFWKNRYKRKKKVVESYDCPARMYLVEPAKTSNTVKVMGKNIKKEVAETEDETNNYIHLTGCLAHNHESAQSKLSVKFRKDVYSRMEQLGMSEEQKSRNFRRFRDLVLQLKKKHGEGFLAEFKSEDVNVTRDLISFNDHFLLRYPQAANSALSSSKSFHAVLKARREMKKKKLLERLRYVHNMVEAMDLTGDQAEDNEDYMDRATAAVRGIPGLVDAFASKRKSQISNSEQQEAGQPRDETEMATTSILPSSSMMHEGVSSPPKKRKKFIKRKQLKEELIESAEQAHHHHQPIETVEHVEQHQVEQVEHHGQQVLHEGEYYVTDESFPYTIIRTTEQEPMRFIETDNGTTIVTFR